MKYAYPAIFTPVEDGGFDVSVPSLPGCRTCGDDLPDAIFMAEDAVSMWLWDAENKRPFPLLHRRRPLPLHSLSAMYMLTLMLIGGKMIIVLSKKHFRSQTG